MLTDVDPPWGRAKTSVTSQRFVKVTFLRPVPTVNWSGAF